MATYVNGGSGVDLQALQDPETMNAIAYLIRSRRTQPYANYVQAVAERLGVAVDEHLYRALTQLDLGVRCEDIILGTVAEVLGFVETHPAANSLASIVLAAYEVSDDDLRLEFESAEKHLWGSEVQVTACMDLHLVPK